MTPAELRKMLDDIESDRAIVKAAEWTDNYVDAGRARSRIAMAGDRLNALFPALLRLWEAAYAVLSGTECTTMGGIIEPGKPRRDTVNICKQKAWLIDDLHAALDVLREIKP